MSASAPVETTTTKTTTTTTNKHDSDLNRYTCRVC